MSHTVDIDLFGSKVSLETGKIAKQAGGSVVVRSGDSVVLVAATSAEKPKPGASFFPLTVDYREYTYAAGKFPGGFIKREGRPSEKEILTSRLIDRPIRPLFPEGYSHETQIIAMVLSADPEYDPGVLSIIGAGAALAISDIPFHHVLGGVRVALINGQHKANASYTESKDSKLNIVVAGTDEGIVMVEAGATEATETEVVKAIEFGHDCCKRIAAGIRELVSKAGKQKREFTPVPVNQEKLRLIEDSIRLDLTDALNTEKYAKIESYSRVDQAKEKALALFTEEADLVEAGQAFTHLKERIFRDEMLKNRRRPDGRAFDQIRPITCEVGVLPRTHGSAIFTRGETQALVTTTLGTKDDEQRIEMFDPSETSKRFMLHYNFPPFSVGEVGFMRGPGRREIGHGALAERALSPMIPDEKAFPYTLRVVSDILESNGSSSMASVCGGTLSLMDAGVPLTKPVAGIAMGLVIEGNDYAVLTDIAGAEDHYGDMDFKVAGTRDGITALQMDIKVTNVTTKIMAEALEQARKGRMEILDKMIATIDKPRTQLSQYAPRIYTTKIPTDKIRELIGPGGKVIKGIIDQTGVKIDVSDDGTVNIFASNGQAANRAMQMVADIAAVAEVGKTYLGKVVRIADFGAFVEIFPGTDGLLHISEISESRIKNVRDELNEGDQILVKVLALEGNKIKLSRKAILKEQREKLKAGAAAGEHAE
ncbi:MAG TPA: polyribonucleotide nucleotidyltransferase [Bryobacteraceae bacterium]|jgi:polyribonucleotide nucleotidyltransferase|nr:polyribonucleotide nucleotidyltransferase [Bryobacteraceae bacterium]